MSITRRTFLHSSLAAAGVPCTALSQAAKATSDPDLARELELIRSNHDIPALGGALVTGAGLKAMAVTGTRKAGGKEVVTPDDQWHLGSNTKAMTATLVALAIEQGLLTWETTLAECYPDVRALRKSPLGGVTLTQLLTHRAGLSHDLEWRSIGRKSDSLPVKRLRALEAAAELKIDPGQKAEYSNIGFVLAGCMLERKWKAAWEDLMREKLFKPLGIANAGFGGTGKPGKVDQPWPHMADGKPAPSNGPEVDNPAIIGPAGSVHMPLGDWARFIADQLAGQQGRDGLLKAASYQKLITPPFADEHAFGWVILQRAWGGGDVVFHNGSNTMNFSVAWLAPKKDFAVLACANRGGDAGTKACDDAAAALLKRMTA